MGSPTLKKFTSFLAWLFLTNEEPPRLRVGWRLALQTFTTFLFIIALMAAAAWSHLLLFFPSEHLLIILQSIGITLAVYTCRKLLDRRSFVSLGLRLNKRALTDFLAGAAISGLALGVLFLGLWVSGLLTVKGVRVDLPMLGYWVVIWLFVGWGEELWARGYWLQNIAEGGHMLGAVIISSIFFGLLHAGNPNITALALVNLMLAGVYLAWGYVRTRSLWLPIGLHFGWNLFEGTVFGFPVSGISPYAVTKIAVSGARWLTGGAFGPEGGLVIWGVMAIGAVLVWAVTRHRQEEVPSQS